MRSVHFLFLKQFAGSGKGLKQAVQKCSASRRILASHLGRCRVGPDDSPDTSRVSWANVIESRLTDAEAG